MKSLFEAAGKFGPVISQYIDEDETNRRLSKPVISALREACFYRLLLPKSLGGLEIDPVTTAKLVEETARHNTAAAWSMMVANVSAWWCKWLPEEGTKEVYKNGPDTLIAGAVHPPMMATPVDGGYRISGKSPLASNVHEADWIFVSAFVMEQGQMKMNNGRPEMVGVLMSAEHCNILDTWYTLGMKATDSNDISAKEVFVPAYLSFPLSPEFQPTSHYAGPLYQFAAIGISTSCLIAPIALAVATNAIQEVKQLAEKKTAMGSVVPLREKGVIQRKFGMAEALVQSSRAYLYNTITEYWNKTLAGEKLSLQDKATLLLTGTHTNQSCLQAIDMMYSAAGTSGIYTRNKLSHYFTDAQVIRQHGFSNDSRYETAAQVYFGLPPDVPVLAF
jgi:indole-3-acetate monooxygenase